MAAGKPLEVGDLIWFDPNGFRIPPIMNKIGRIREYDALYDIIVIDSLTEVSLYSRGRIEVRRLTDEEAMIWKLENG